FTEIVRPYDKGVEAGIHEAFIYVLYGSLHAEVGEERADVSAGGIIHLPIGSRYRIRTDGQSSVRFVSVTSTEKLEAGL
ncbi:MAG: cupin domain-containing protein, partial [Deltaproteobacteria bacterium]|nr:cupin domain-containing protein [Deltaproteobacteria bacterium]